MIPTYREYKDISYQTHKISLDFYRKASMQIMKVLNGFCTQFQRASIDEAFLDLSQQVTLEMQSLRSENIEEPCVDWSDSETFVIGFDQNNLNTLKDVKDVKDAKDLEREKQITRGWTDWKLKKACEMTFKIRKAVYDQLGYTCSAGISNNKMLSKLISSTHKPNKQSVLLDSYILEYMKPISFKSLRGLGGISFVVGINLIENINRKIRRSNYSSIWYTNHSRIMYNFIK